MKLITPLCAILLTIGFCPRAAHAQDSPIIINDNGGVPVPIQTEGKGGKAPSKAKKGARGVTTSTFSDRETHIHHAREIKDVDNEFFIDLTNYRAVCFETSKGEIDLADGKWTLKTLSRLDSTLISSAGNSHIHIDPGRNMVHRPKKDMDDPDPADVAKGTRNQLTGVDFEGVTYGVPFIIHYCGPAARCLGGKDGKTDQCPKAKDRKPE